MIAPFQPANRRQPAWYSHHLIRIGSKEIRMQIADLPVTEILKKLVACPSVTTESNQRVNDLMGEMLRSIHFEVNAFEYVDGQGVTKWGIEARRFASNTPSEDSTQDSGSNQTAQETDASDRDGAKLSTAKLSRAELSRAELNSGIGYFCHNDVVSVAGWDAPHGGPFDPKIADKRLWGRGSCDMKGSAAAALAALARIAPNEQTGPVYYFVTGDEECGMTGADWIAERSEFFKEMVAGQMLGIIGEPTSLRLVNAHKGGYYIKVQAQGLAAHSSTDDGRNANWELIPFLSFLRELDHRLRTEASLQNQAFSPNHMSMNVVVQNEPATSNITVAEARCQLYLRPMPEMPWQDIVQEILGEAKRLGLQVLETRELPPVATLATSPAVVESLRLLKQDRPDAVSYATDGCCLGDLENLVILGPGSIEQAHRSDEYIDLDQLTEGVEVFESFFRRFACS